MYGHTRTDADSQDLTKKHSHRLYWIGAIENKLN